MTWPRKTVSNPKPDAEVPEMLEWLRRHSWSASTISRWSKQALVRLITHLDQKYWAGEDSGLPDQAYDILIQALARKEPNHPLIHKVNG